jgi:dipeptidyl-peptidase-4
VSIRDEPARDDLDRIGDYGHSFGGYTSARAILSHPEFYKVGVSAAGPQNFQGFYQGLENLIGLPRLWKGRKDSAQL